MALRERSNTAGDMMGNAVDSSDSSPSSTTKTSGHPPGSSASSIRSLRKRYSFFSRSSSDAGRARKLIPHHSSTPSQDSTQEQIPPRPSTALSADQSSIRSSSKPFDTIRDSIFGGRRNGPTISTRGRADSGVLPGAFASAVPTWSPEHFSNKDDYERHLTKQAISPPFNFMHVTHTEKAKLPALEAVDEKALPGDFWSVAYQRPRRHLHGIKAEDLRRQPREMSPISPISTNSHSRPISPILEDVHDDRPVIPRTVENMSPLDETMFDEIAQTRFDPDDGALSLQPAKHVVKYPKRYSSLNALNALAQAEVSAENMNAFYESSSDVSEDPRSQTVSPNTTDDQPDRTDPAHNNIEASLANIPDFPLPPLPERRPSKNQFRQSATTKPASKISLIIPVQQPVPPRSKRSSRSPKSKLKSPTFSPHSERQNSLAFSDGTWEDDVDFCYEQAAESTCNFNWDPTNISRHTNSTTSTSENRRPSVSPSYHAYSPVISNDSESSFRFNGTNVSNETIADRRRSRTSQAPSQHKRGSSVASVGHRGFLAARKSSTDLTALANPNPAPLQISPNPAQVNVLSPIFSVNGADEEPQKTPFTPAAFHYTRFDSVITENLSDPESYRNSASSKHRKSSSYGSHESTARGPPDAAKEKNRWSVASVSSLPDLLHPRSKHKVLSKMVISSPLESLPQSPPIEPDGAPDSTIVPRELQTQPVRNSFVVRRQPSSREAAKRAVQRKGTSSETPKRMSRIVQTPDGMAVPEATKTGPQWI